MAIQLDVQNFRNLRSVTLHDDAKMSVIVGRNEAGKSSLIGAIQFGFTGQAFGHKGKEIEKLLRRGEDRMTIRIKVGQHLVCRTRTTGDSLKGLAERLAVPSDCLPLLFDSELNGDGGSKAMRTFLDSVASTTFDPLLHFANDPVLRQVIEQALKAGKRSAKQIVEYCEAMRASQKQPPMPVMPSVSKPTNETVESLSTEAKARYDVWQAKLKAADDAKQMARKIMALSTYSHQLREYNAAKAIASRVDTLGAKREALTRLANMNLSSLQAMVNIVKEATDNASIHTSVAACLVQFQSLVTAAQEKLKHNPPPASMPNMPQLDDEARVILEALDSTGRLVEDEAAIAALLTNATALSDSFSVDADKAKLESLTADKERDTALANRGAWEAYDAAIPVWEDAKIKATTEWERWDRAAKDIVKAETEHVDKAGDEFGKKVAEFSSSILQGRKVTISRDEGIFLGPDPVADLSKSTRWRIEVAVMAAVAQTLKSPMLVIDGADILDAKNRELVTQFLLQKIVPAFEHVIVTSTLRGSIEEEKIPPEGSIMTKWALVDGELTRLVKAPEIGGAN
jgi:hypothetical protein